MKDRDLFDIVLVVGAVVMSFIAFFHQTSTVDNSVRTTVQRASANCNGNFNVHLLSCNATNLSGQDSELLILLAFLAAIAVVAFLLWRVVHNGG